MQQSRHFRTRSAAVALAFTLILVGAPVHAHCDKVNGPVVNEARTALGSGDVTSVLKWIPAQGEQEVRAAFDRAVAVRDESPEVRDLADRYLLETVVRVHRASEGATFTGLKSADTPISPAIERSDEALANGNVDELASDIAAAVEQSIRDQYAATMEARAQRDDSVQEGREFVAQYVPFVHYVKRIHETVEEGPRAHDHSH